VVGAAFPDASARRAVVDALVIPACIEGEVSAAGEAAVRSFAAALGVRSPWVGVLGALRARRVFAVKRQLFRHAPDGHRVAPQRGPAALLPVAGAPATLAALSSITDPGVEEHQPYWAVRACSRRSVATTSPGRPSPGPSASARRRRSRRSWPLEPPASLALRSAALGVPAGEQALARLLRRLGRGRAGT